MADVDTGSLDKPNAPPAGLPVLLEEARRELRDDIVLGHGGRTALARFAERFDGLLRQILDAAPRTEPVAPSRSWRSAATAASSCACTPTSISSSCSAAISGSAEERLLRAILHPLWDLGLVVGHQVREIDEFARLEVDNPEFLMALRRRAPGRGRPRALPPLRDGVPSRRHPRARRRRAEHAHRRALRAVQLDALISSSRTSRMRPARCAI